MPQFLKSRIWRLTGVGLIAFIVLLALAAFAHRDNIFRWIINPNTPFQTYAPPPAPDYANESSWALLPATPPPAAWAEEWGVDVFFIHPTTHDSKSNWNAPISDPVTQERLTNSILPNHARPFAKAGQIYAPRYRQASLFTEINFGEDSRQSLLLAYSDVVAAFDYYLQHHNRGRAIILAGVGQGGFHAQRLLSERFEDPLIRERLVAAYLIDSAAPADLSDTQWHGLSSCHTRTQINCVISWGVVYEGDEDEAARFRNRSKTWSLDGRIYSTARRGLICVNPLLWSTNGDFAPGRLHRGGAQASVLDMDAEPAILPGAVSTQCVDGVLITDRPSERQLRRKISLGARFKTPDFNLFYADIEANAAERARLASEWLNANGHKPARPLPKAIGIAPAPVTEVQDELVNPSSALRPLTNDAED